VLVNVLVVVDLGDVALVEEGDAVLAASACELAGGKKAVGVLEVADINGGEVSEGTVPVADVALAPVGSVDAAFGVLGKVVPVTSLVQKNWLPQNFTVINITILRWCRPTLSRGCARI